MKEEKTDPNAQRKSFLGRYGQKRFKADHTFYFDRHGLHIFLALWVSLVAIGMYHLLGVVAGQPVAGVLAAFGWIVVITHVFIVYETRESDDINDKGWIDIGAYMNGMAFGGPAEVGLYLAFPIIWRLVTGVI